MAYQLRMTFEERLAQIRRGPEECWVWVWAKTKGGYGHFAHRENGAKRYTYAHRAAYEKLVGPIPAKHHLDHSCGNKACCNPAHLTNRTPRQHRVRHTKAMTKCCRGHDLTVPRAFRFPRRQSNRQCRLCYEGWIAVRWKPAEREAYRVSKRRKLDVNPETT